jgi:hypothetical protein
MITYKFSDLLLMLIFMSFSGVFRIVVDEDDEYI